MRNHCPNSPFMQKIPLLAGLLFLLPALASGTEIYQTRIFKDEIKTLRVQYAEHPVLQRPYLTLPEDGYLDGSDGRNTLDISFDCLSHDTRRYTYTVLHLNSDYTRSGLSSIEYLDGFTTQDISDYQLSVNTQQEYTHYSFFFPNEDMRLKVSGNYALLIYEDGRPEDIVAQVCFQVTEDIVGISTRVRSNTDIELNGRYQQADIDIATGRLKVTSPNEITVAVQQNGRYDNMVRTNRPTFVESNRLRFINQKELIFEGGNEYRHFDIYSVYYAGYNVDRVRYDEGEYYALLDIDANRGLGGLEGGVPTHRETGVPYLFENDADGQFIVNAERTDDSDTEAEYMRVYWTLPMPEPFLDGSIYIGGDIFQNRTDHTNRMNYDADQRCYFFSALVKQGGYDYQYWFVGNSPRSQNREPGTPKKATLLRAEGSHWETENLYTISVYYRPIGGRYDRLVGIQTYSSSSR